ncbi:MAG: nucleoside-diphosphate kinase [Opitutae bacterium]|nr:nucleoside-diphosphate kinase [Opitutae bacterium]MBT5380099.1 nucleoside-diphosphate kinase [Opitutae bacterium]MBT5689794.1 nucleoside-diphosphate kinase [Opitutae bacterium]MBT6460993.1 nucleoside-diphosphate kinase [Opitutae bacterium]MBT6957185.1 nucleoside-diphosphate kinase [Opitutae bacterium]
MEKTLVILKPDCMENRCAGNVISRFEKEGFAIFDCKLVQLSSPILEEHYAHIRQLEHVFPMLVDFMSSRPVMVMILQGDNVIMRIRDLLGPTDPAEASDGTIRGDFGVDKTRNVAHASDSLESAVVEIRRFFG